MKEFVLLLKQTKSFIKKKAFIESSFVERGKVKLQSTKPFKPHTLKQVREVEIREGLRQAMRREAAVSLALSLLLHI